MAVSRPYTQRFIAWSSGGPKSEAYVVPAGFRIVVRSLMLWSDATANTIYVQIGSVPVLLWAPPGAFTHLIEAVHIAVYAGETLSVYHGGSATGGQLAGYIFDDPSGPIGRQVTRSLQVPAPLPAVAA